MKCSQVAVLRGGPSTEYDVSLKTGAGVLSVLEDEMCGVRDIIISRSGEWVVDGFVKTPEQALTGVDVVFIALHGAYGEDGTVQRILDRLGIPYTGSTAYASSVAMNKALTKDLLREQGILMPRHIQIQKAAVREVRQTAESIARIFGPEYVVKPLSGGSSFHTELVTGFAALAGALSRVLTHSDTVLVEERIRGREATVAILDGFRSADYYLLPVIEIIPPPEAAFFDSAVKYDGRTEEICPGRFSQFEASALQAAALSAHRTLGLRHYSRADFIVTESGPYFLEINTLPGLTAESLFPKAIEAVGGSYRELVRHLINLATKNVSYV